jgi:hypothetical protein
VQYRPDVVVEVAVGEAYQEFLLVEVVVDLAGDEIDAFVRAGQVVDRDDARLAAAIERLDEVGADESGGPGDEMTLCASVPGRMPGGGAPPSGRPERSGARGAFILEFSRRGRRC